MKKIFIFLILVCLLGVSAFAQLNVGAYTKSYWTPYRLTVPEEGDMSHTTGVQAPWGEPDISAGVNFDGWSEWGGLHLGVDIANGAANRPATAFSAKGSGWVWVKPLGFSKTLGVDTLTIWLGNPVDEKLMGKIGGSNLVNYVLSRSYMMHDDGTERSFRMEYQDASYNIFTRINPYPWGNANELNQNIWWPRIAGAAMLTWEPIKDMYFNAFIAPEMLRLLDWNKDSAGMNNPKVESINGSELRSDDINQDFYDVKEVYSKMQIALGYKIPGLGLARVQWVGVRNVFELAYQQSLGDITFDAGIKIPYEGTEKDPSNAYLTSKYKKKRDYQASVAATYRFYDFRMLGRIDTAFLGSDSSGSKIKQSGLDMIVYLVPSYQLGVGTVGADIGFEYEQKDDFNGWEKDSVQGGLGVWFARGMGNANFKIAVVSRFPFEWKEKKLPFELMIPIILEVGF
jgi:hypothetical protein